MKRIIFLLVVSILLSSYATIMHQPHMNVAIHTTEPSVIIYKEDTINTVNNETDICVERKNEILSFEVITDSISKKIEVKNRLSDAFWWGNVFSGVGIIGHAIDLANPKRFTYPKKVYINSAERENRYYRYNPGERNKGELYLDLSLPHINSFFLRPPKESYEFSIGFWGLSAGLDYYHSQNQFINMSISGVMDFFLPVPAAVDLSGEYKNANSVYLSLSNNYKINRFSTGYGLSYGRNTWNFVYHNRFDPPPPTREPVTRRYDTFGFIFPAYYQVGEYFNMGIIYRPSFYRPNLPIKFSYEHLISIDFAWKIRLKK